MTISVNFKKLSRILDLYTSILEEDMTIYVIEVSMGPSGKVLYAPAYSTKNPLCGILPLIIKSSVNPLKPVVSKGFTRYSFENSVIALNEATYSKSINRALEIKLCLKPFILVLVRYITAIMINKNAKFNVNTL
jgi:hypothetical protein